MTELEILFHDEYYVAINKPSGLLAHRSTLSTETENALKYLKKQINKKVYPVHRLDKATSGIMIFALDVEPLKLLSKEFENKNVIKKYYAICRGYTKDFEKLDYPLTNDETNITQDAITEYKKLNQVELNIPIGRYNTSRYSLVEITPLTGRRHQIRKHFHHISHHIIGDTTYGDGKHNRMFREKFGINRLLLTAFSISFKHPYTNETVNINTELDKDFSCLFKEFNWKI